MKLYKCRVRLAGLVHHEVPKFGITDKEVAILRSIHGSDAVVGFKNDGEAKRTDAEEFQRLADIYGEGIVQKLFGNVLGTLTDIEVEEDDEVDVPDVATVGTVIKASKPPVMKLTEPEVALD